MIRWDTPGTYYWTVPAGITEITVNLTGASGGHSFTTPGDLLRVDVDTAGTGAKGLVVSIEFEKAAI